MSVGKGALRVLYLSVESDNPVSDLEDLSEWLSHEPGLRGLIADGVGEPGQGKLGTAVDVLIAAVGSGGAFTVLITSLQSYLSNHGTDLTVKLTGPRGSISLDAKRARDPEALVRAAREAVGVE